MMRNVEMQKLRLLWLFMNSDLVSYLMKSKKWPQIRFVLLFVTVIRSSAVCAVSIEFDQQVMSLTDNFMRQVASGDYFGAMTKIAPYSIASVENLKGLAEKIKEGRNRSAKLGKTIGYEYIEEYKQGASAWKIVYLEKAEKDGIVWRFFWYKSKDGWVLTYINVTEGVENFLK